MPVDSKKIERKSESAQGRTTRICMILYAIGTFAFLLLYFVKINPIAVFDTDDWLYISQFRAPIPMVQEWNPIKVFPETFMPLISYAGAYLIYPLSGDYCNSLSCAHGVFIAVVLTTYFCQFVFLMRKRMKESLLSSILLGIIFFCLHFLLLWQFHALMESLLYAFDLTCIYNYTLSTIINATLVMHLISCGGVDQGMGHGTKLHRILCIIWIYFCINSNLFSSIVLAFYIGASLLVSWFSYRNEKAVSVKSFGEEHKASILILLCWIGSHLFELTGGRAGDSSSNIGHSLGDVCIRLFEWIPRINAVILVLSLICVVVWYMKCRKTIGPGTATIILATAFTAIYLVLLCTVVDNLYMSRPEVFFAIVFWGLLALMLCVGKLHNRTRKELLLFPVSLLLSVCTIATISSHKVVNYNGLSYESSQAVMNDIISQFMSVEKSGLTEIELIVPDFDSEDNWPIATYAGNRISGALYKHGVIENFVRVDEVIPSKEKTDQLVRYQ